MSLPTSEYTIPIFVSSTDYNLKDLRAELARYLEELGYKPILSSAEGFHDNHPILEPWESCLEVLRTTPIMILVLDSRYGKSLNWPHYPELGGKEVSPTHAEYLFARHHKKRMLVFVREEVMIYYQSYRTAMENAKKNKNVARKILEKALPKHIEFEALEFIHEVKTEKPIPWIKQFADVTDIKKEIQKKMLNELAEIFLLRDKHLQTVVRAFTSLLDEATPEKREDLLKSNPFVNELMLKIEAQNKDLVELDGQKSQLESKISEMEKGLLSAQGSEEKTIALQKEVARLKGELLTVNQLKNQLYNLNTGLDVYGLGGQKLWQSKPTESRLVTGDFFAPMPKTSLMDYISLDDKQSLKRPIPKPLKKIFRKEDKADKKSQSEGNTKSQDSKE